MPKYNTWNVPFSSINWFEDAIRTHDKVNAITREEDILFTVDTLYGKTYKVLLLDEYRLGEAAVIKAIQEFGKLDFIVYGGNWNKATSEAYRIAETTDIALFDYSGFMGALNFKEPKGYTPNGKKKITTISKRA